MNKEVMAGLAWGGGAVALALAMTLARKLGHVDADTVTRVVIGFNGLMIAWYGNRMPKMLAPSAIARKVARVGGWSQVVSGVVYVGLWAFAPIQVAVWVGSAVVLVGVAVPLAYCLSLRSRAKAEAA